MIESAHRLIFSKDSHPFAMIIHCSFRNSLCEKIISAAEGGGGIWSFICFKKVKGINTILVANLIF